MLDSLVNQAETAALAEPAQALTMEAAIRLALERNPTLAAARREIEAVDAQILQGSLRPNPEFVYLAEDTRSVTRTSTAQLDVPIEMGGKRGARVDAATRNKNSAVSELMARQQEFLPSWCRQQTPPSRRPRSCGGNDVGPPSVRRRVQGEAYGWRACFQVRRVGCRESIATIPLSACVWPLRESLTVM
ncbi:MAG: TolC family protein [Usitatibacteraceae bacterium]